MEGSSTGAGADFTSIRPQVPQLGKTSKTQGWAKWNHGLSHSKAAFYILYRDKDQGQVKTGKGKTSHSNTSVAWPSLCVVVVFK